VRQSGEQFHAVSHLSSFVRSFHNSKLQALPCPQRRITGKKFRRHPAAVQDILTSNSNDKTSPTESHRVSRPSHQKESTPNFDSSRTSDEYKQHREMEGNWSSDEISVIGHQTCPGSRRFEELILSTPFGTFHRAPLSFWPAQSGAGPIDAGQQTTGSSHRQGSRAGNSIAISDNEGICDRKQRRSSDERGSLPASHSATEVRNGTEMQREVIVRFHWQILYC